MIVASILLNFPMNWAFVSQKIFNINKKCILKIWFILPISGFTELSCTFPDYYCNPTAPDLIRKVEDVSVNSAKECQDLCKRQVPRVYVKVSDFIILVKHPTHWPMEAFAMTLHSLTSEASRPASSWETARTSDPSALFQLPVCRGDPQLVANIVPSSLIMRRIMLPGDVREASTPTRRIYLQGPLAMQSESCVQECHPIM